MNKKPLPPKPRRLIVYTGSDPKQDYASLFYLNLFWAVMGHGRDLGYEMIPLIDTRPENRRSLEPPEVAKIQKDGGLDGIIGLMLWEVMTEWMEERGAPFVALGEGKGKKRLVFDFEGLICDSFTRLAELGCRSVGLMVPPHLATSAVLEYMDGLAETLKLSINYEFILVSQATDELNGYNQFCSLWELKKRPDGLVIFPDVTARGVVSAIVERKVRIPQELKLVLHRNAETPYMVPFPCDWIEIKVQQLALAMFRVLDRQWNGEKERAEDVHFKLIKSR